MIRCSIDRKQRPHINQMARTNNPLAHSYEKELENMNVKISMLRMRSNTVQCIQTSTLVQDEAR